MVERRGRGKEAFIDLLFFFSACVCYQIVCSVLAPMTGNCVFGI